MKKLRFIKLFNLVKVTAGKLSAGGIEPVLLAIKQPYNLSLVSYHNIRW